MTEQDEGEKESTMPHWRSLTESKYLAAFDLQGRDVHVQIERIIGDTITGTGGMKSKKPLAHFKGKSKPMVLNATNCKTITNIVGDPDITKWAGQWITLFPTTTQSAAGETVDCLRVRPRAPDPTKLPKTSGDDQAAAQAAQ